MISIPNEPPGDWPQLTSEVSQTLVTGGRVGAGGRASGLQVFVLKEEGDMQLLSSMLGGREALEPFGVVVFCDGNLPRGVPEMFSDCGYIPVVAEESRFTGEGWHTVVRARNENRRVALVCKGVPPIP